MLMSMKLKKGKNMPVWENTVKHEKRGSKRSMSNFGRKAENKSHSKKS